MVKLQMKLNNTWTTMPNCHYEVTPVKIETEYTMSDGSTAVDYIGTRVKLTANFGYIPSSTFQALNTEINNGGSIEVRYQGADGSTLQTVAFRFEPITRQAFKSVNNVITWIQPSALTGISSGVVQSV